MIPFAIGVFIGVFIGFFVASLFVVGEEEIE